MDCSAIAAFVLLKLYVPAGFFDWVVARDIVEFHLSQIVGDEVHAFELRFGAWGEVCFFGIVQTDAGISLVAISRLGDGIPPLEFACVLNSEFQDDVALAFGRCLGMFGGPS
jgi:hypothetical protein